MRSSPSFVEVAMGELQRRGRVLASFALIASAAIVGAEAKVSGPVIDCPFSLLPQLRLQTESFCMFCNIFGEGQTAN
ncbi:MAG TPA: hypothetical protein VII84_09105 [Acidimicrobiales bacterium]